MASTAGPPPDPIYVFQGFDSGVSSVSFVHLRKKHYLLTGDSAGESALWDLATRKCVWKHQERKGPTPPSIVACGQWSRGIWSHARGSFVRFWKIDDDQPLESCTIPVGHIGFCAASVFTKEDYPEVDFVAVPTEKDEHHSIEIYQVSEGEPSRLAIVDLTSETESPPIGSPMTCFLTDLAPASAMLLIVGFESGNVRIWRVDAASVRIIAQAKLIQEAVMDMAFDRDRRFGFCVSPEKAVKCWRLVDDNENSSSFRIENSDDIALPRPGASSVRIRDDGKIFAVGGWDGKIRVFACKTQKPLAVLQFHSDTVRCVCFCKGRVDGRRLMAAGSKDGSVSLWNLYSD